MAVTVGPTGSVCARCHADIGPQPLEVCPFCFEDPSATAVVLGPAGEAAAVADDREPAPSGAVTLAAAGVRLRLAPGQNMVLGRAGDGPLGVALDRFYGDVGRRHATLAVAGQGRVDLCDLGSRNGTFVGDQRLEAHVVVRAAPPTWVRLGRNCFLELGVADD